MQKIHFAFFGLLLFFSTQMLAQIKAGQIFDQSNNQTLPFVNITINHSKVGLSADINGRFEINYSQPITSLTFSFMGYAKKSIQINANTPWPLKVFLEPDVEVLNEIVLVAGENPAHRIIKNTTANRKINNPKNLYSFSYTSYNKFILTLQKDSLPPNVAPLFEDSTMQELEAFMSRQHIMIMESASERKYKKPNLDNEVIVANKISGLKNPTFVFLANQLQSFSFYEDFVSVLSIDYLNPISKGSTKKYRFLIQDTTYAGADTTFVISFQPKKGANFKGLKGYLYINTKAWAIQNVLAQPAQQEEVTVVIQQLYKEFPGASWFPYQMNYDFVFNSLDLGGIKMLGIGKTFLSDVKINPELSRKDFSNIAIKIENDASKKSESILNDYRKDSLTSKDVETYRVIDSLGKAENFEGKLRWLTALTEGKVRWGRVDFPLKHLVRYNLYEGFRLGLGAETNPNLIDWLTIGGNFAYGFKDKTWKYGYYGTVTLNKKHNLKLGGGYQFDIYESGGQHWIDQPQRTILSEGNTRLIWVEQFDELSQAYGFATWHPRPNLHTKVQLSRENRYMPGSYGYLTTNSEGNSVWQNGFIASLAQVSVRWAPYEKYMEGPFGRKPMGRAFPVFTAQYSQGIDGLFDGTLDFKRIDLKVRHDIKTRIFGITTLVAEGGKVFGDVPYSYLYNGRSNKPLTYDGFLLVADKFSFETMLNNEFLNDQFVHAMIRHNFQSRFLKVGTWAPEVEILLRGLWGTLDHPEKHHGFDFKDARQGFFETGIELNKLYNSLGLGFYYRFGPNQLPNTKDNLAFKLSYSVLLF